MQIHKKFAFDASVPSIDYERYIDPDDLLNESFEKLKDDFEAYRRKRGKDIIKEEQLQRKQIQDQRKKGSSIQNGFDEMMQESNQKQLIGVIDRFIKHQEQKCKELHRRVQSRIYYNKILKLNSDNRQQVKNNKFKNLRYRNNLYLQKLIFQDQLRKKKKKKFMDNINRKKPLDKEKDLLIKKENINLGLNQENKEEKIQNNYKCLLINNPNQLKMNNNQEERKLKCIQLNYYQKNHLKKKQLEMLKILLNIMIFQEKLGRNLEFSIKKISILEWNHLNKLNYKDYYLRLQNLSNNKKTIIRNNQKVTILMHSFQML